MCRFLFLSGPTLMRGRRNTPACPEVEVPRPIAAAPLRSVRPHDGAGPSRSLEGFTGRPTGRLPEGIAFQVECSVSSSSSSNDRAASRTEGAKADDFVRTASHVNQAIGTIGLTGLAATESSNEASPSRACEVDIEGLGDVPATPQVTGGEFCFTVLLCD